VAFLALSRQRGWIFEGFLTLRVMGPCCSIQALFLTLATAARNFCAQQGIPGSTAMKTRLVTVGVCLSLMGFVVLAPGRAQKDKPGPMSGTWECTAHGFQQGDLPFTLLLEQSGETVSGSVTSPNGDANISSATFKDDTLDVRIDTGQVPYLLTAKLKEGKLAGSWSHGPEKGTWEGSKQDKMDP
jgi:hypothetical protein